jgi:hypothetical protein
MHSPIFSHNLALSMIDIEGDTSVAAIILHEIKTRITEIPRIQSIIYKGFPFNAIVDWKHVSLGPPFRMMMGDLFTECPYPDDEVVNSHTRQMIYEIETEMKEKYPNTQWCLVFHLSKIISMCIPSNICEPELGRSLLL